MFTSIVSEGMVREIGQKLHLPRIVRRYGITDEDRRWLFRLLLTQAETADVAPADVPTVTGDPEDDYILATCRVSRADYLVTGDQGLLALRSYEGTEIVTPRQFADLLGNTTSERPAGP